MRKAGGEVPPSPPAPSARPQMCEDLLVLKGLFPPQPTSAPKDEEKGHQGNAGNKLGELWRPGPDPSNPEAPPLKARDAVFLVA